MDDLNDVYVDVALACYERVRALKTGSEDAEVAEHAISLALERRNSDKDAALLLHDVLRNSRHSLRRGQARHLRAVEASGQLAERGVASGGCAGFVDADTPEHICIARETMSDMHAAAAACGRHGTRVLTGLLDGETSAETAHAAGISRATVERTVRHLRDAAIGAGLRTAA